MVYSTEEYRIYLEAQELRDRARRLQSKADKMRYQREKQAEEDRKANKVKRAREAFALDVENLKIDISKTIPVAYGNHIFTISQYFSDNEDSATLTIQLFRLKRLQDGE